MINTKLSLKFTKGFFSETEFQTAFQKAEENRKALLQKKGKGSDFLGWLTLPSSISESEIQKINSTYKRLSEHSEYLVAVGIGGSYLGARAIIEAGLPFFEKKVGMKVLYAGHHIDSDYHKELLSFLENVDFSVNVISKSGTTTEPALAFRSLYSLLVKKYGESKAKKRVVATTDKTKGALKKFSDEKGFETYIIPDDVGGRFSVLTPVGLLPIACAGLNIQELVSGAQRMQDSLIKTEGKENLANIYSAYRNTLYEKGKKVEILVNYNPKLYYFTEWWKQLYGESEGKEKKGIFPVGVNFTTAVSYTHLRA
ncbi:MAG: glucose-6-phosphate isomerase, partial [Leptospiraceae bacterium]|nr:glucose-6-phosphate isomerase [Leptospiraceae bacterium]